ncbi:STXB protein, partial [Amia calva]|nr:STXB protein [Amia calva]
MAFPRSLLSEELFQCSICLHTFTRPVPTPCTEAEVQQEIQDRQTSVNDVRHAVDPGRLGVQREVEDSEKVFRALVRSTERSQAKLLEQIEEKHRAAERRAEGLTEELSHTEDHIHFLQVSTVTSPSGKWAAIGVAYKGIRRKGNSDICGLGHSDKSWSLTCVATSCTTMHNNSKTVIDVYPSQRVGVYLDWPAGTVSFHSISSDTLTPCTPPTANSMSPSLQCFGLTLLCPCASWGALVCPAKKPVWSSRLSYKHNLMLLCSCCSWKNMTWTSPRDRLQIKNCSGL